MMKTSIPRTFSLISTRVSPSLNAVTWALSEGNPQILADLLGQRQICISGKNSYFFEHLKSFTSQTFNWLGREDSNLRMQDPNSCVLPLDDAPVPIDTAD